VILLPWHLSDRLVGGLNVTLPSDTIEVPAELGSTGQRWAGSGERHSPLRDERSPTLTVFGRSLGLRCVPAVTAGIQQRGIAAAVSGSTRRFTYRIHHTFDTGGLPLAKVGRGLTCRLHCASGAVPEEWRSSAIRPRPA
jgi:hypothetical protein